MIPSGIKNWVLYLKQTRVTLDSNPPAAPIQIHACYHASSPLRRSPLSGRGKRLSDFASPLPSSLHLARLENGVGLPPRSSSFLYDFPSLLPSLCGLEYSVLGRVKWPPGPPSFPPSFGLYAGCPIRRAQKPRTRPSSFPIYGPGASAFL